MATEIELKLKYNFDLKPRRIQIVALLIKEKRAIGHVGPGLDVVAKLIMKVTPIAESVHLRQESLSNCRHRPRGWNSSSSNPLPVISAWTTTDAGISPAKKNVAIMRLVDKGELVAQCNISPIPTVQKQLTLAAYQQEISQSLGKNFGRFRGIGRYQRSRIPSLSGGGQRAGVRPAHRLDLLSADELRTGNAVVVVHHGIEPEGAFGAADRALLGSLHFGQPPIDAAAKQPTVR